MTDVVGAAIRRINQAVPAAGYLGCQVYASVWGEPVMDAAYGQLTPSVPLTVGDRLPWVCNGKPIAAIALAQLADIGALTPATPVADIIPEYASNGKDAVTVAQLMSHSVPYAPQDGPPLAGLPDTEALQAVCDSTITAPPGSTAQYSIYESWLVLAEIVRRVTGVPFDEHVESAVLNPLQMARTVFGERRSIRSGYTDHLLYELVDGTAAPTARIGPAFMAPRLIATGAAGPAAEMARPFESLLDKGPWRGQVLSESAVELLTTSYRVGLTDETFGGLDLSWGFGVCTDPLWFGAPIGHRVAGHTGYNCALVVCDLDLGLVVSFASSSVVMSERGRSRLENKIVADLYGLVA